MTPSYSAPPPPCVFLPARHLTPDPDPLSLAHSSSTRIAQVELLFVRESWRQSVSRKDAENDAHAQDKQFLLDSEELVIKEGEVYPGHHESLKRMP